MNEELDQKIFNYIALLEKTNEELVKTLKKSVALLTEFKSSVPNPDGWQRMLDTFQETIRVGERIVEKEGTSLNNSIAHAGLKIVENLFP